MTGIRVLSTNDQLRCRAARRAVDVSASGDFRRRDALDSVQVGTRNNRTRSGVRGAGSEGAGRRGTRRTVPTRLGAARDDALRDPPRYHAATVEVGSDDLSADGRFYKQPTSVADLVDRLTVRILDLFGLSVLNVRCWAGMPAAVDKSTASGSRLWISHAAWQPWIEHCATRGHRVVTAPAWRCELATVAATRDSAQQQAHDGLAAPTGARTKLQQVAKLAKLRQPLAKMPVELV